jgi:hypothetical protein
MNKKKNPARKLQGQPKKRKPNNPETISRQLNALLFGNKSKPQAEVQFYSLAQMLDMAETTFTTLLKAHTSQGGSFEHERDLLFAQEIVSLCKEKYDLPVTCAGILLVNIGLGMLQNAPFEEIAE